ncbi:hypothetical protein DIE19_29375 [Burkholderia sp. Bp9126]|nr:hypothetical protein DIE19_29375 [Burkholderia sp. Bp9126]
MSSSCMRSPAGSVVCVGRAAGDPGRGSSGCRHSHSALAGVGGRRVRGVAAGLAEMIRIDAIWLATEPIDMRAGTDTLLARVVKVFGAVRPHHAYLFANRDPIMHFEVRT